MINSQVGKWDQNTAQVKRSVQMCSSSNLGELCMVKQCHGMGAVLHLVTPERVRIDGLNN